MISTFSGYIYALIPKFLRGGFTRESLVVYIYNIQWVAIWKILTTAFSLITTMVVARLLGPEQFGVLSYVTSITGLFGVFGSLGLGYIIYAEIVQRKEERTEILGSGIFLTMMTGLVAFFLMLLYVTFMEESFYIKSLIILLSFSFFTAPLSYLHVDFLKDKEARFVAITQIITNIVSGLCKILSVLIFGSLYLFILTVVLENMLAGSLYLYQIKHIKKRSIRFLPSKERMYGYFVSAIPLTALSAFNEIYYRIDQILLKHMVNVTTVGLYATAVRLTEIWYVVPNILIAALFPALASASVGTKTREYTKRFRIFLGIIIATSLIITSVIIIIGKYCIEIIYGKTFLPASEILSIYIFSLPGSFVSALIMQDMFLMKKTWHMVIFSSCTAVVNILGCLLFIPSYGALGAAYATVISYNITPAIYYLLRYFRKKPIFIG
jgi:O-antigen/teichoic acid export membrane protein